MKDDGRGTRRGNGRLAVLPLGATEYHGPHLPAETDAIIAAGIADRVRRKVADELDVIFLPAEPVGYSPEHLDHPLTRSLGYADAVERWCGIGESLADRGIAKLLLLNAHGGNSPLMTVVSTELRIRRNMLCVATSWTRFEQPEQLLPEHEVRFGIHGGMAETSVMLALRPDLVSMDAAAHFTNFQEELTRSTRYLRAYGPHAFGWKMADLNPHGAVGDSGSATADKGERLIDNVVTGLCLLLREMDRFDLGHFRHEK